MISNKLSSMAAFNTAVYTIGLKLSSIADRHGSFSSSLISSQLEPIWFLVSGLWFLHDEKEDADQDEEIYRRMLKNNHNHLLHNHCIWMKFCLTCLAVSFAEVVAWTEKSWLTILYICFVLL